MRFYDMEKNKKRVTGTSTGKFDQTAIGIAQSISAKQGLATNADFTHRAR